MNEVSLLATGLRLSAERHAQMTNNPVPVWATKPDVVASWLEFLSQPRK